MRKICSMLMLVASLVLIWPWTGDTQPGEATPSAVLSNPVPASPLTGPAISPASTQPDPLPPATTPSAAEAAIAAQARRGNLVPRLMGMMEAGIDWVLWLLFALGAACLFVLVERTIYFAMYTRGITRAQARMCEFLDRSDLKAAEQHFRSRNDIVSRVLAEAIAHRVSAPEAIAELVESRVMLERQRLERGLSLVATVGANAPFIGLFGTVLGIIRAFHDLSNAEHAGPAIVMAGISEALVATAVGLLIAIPAVIIFNVFKARTRTVIAGAESVFKLFLSHQLDQCLRPQAALAANNQEITNADRG